MTSLEISLEKLKNINELLYNLNLNISALGFFRCGFSGIAYTSRLVKEKAGREFDMDLRLPTAPSVFSEVG